MVNGKQSGLCSSRRLLVQDSVRTCRAASEAEYLLYQLHSVKHGIARTSSTVRCFRGYTPARLLAFHFSSSFQLLFTDASQDNYFLYSHYLMQPTSPDHEPSRVPLTRCDYALHLWQLSPQYHQPYRHCLSLTSNACSTVCSIYLLPGQLAARRLTDRSWAQ